MVISTGIYSNDRTERYERAGDDAEGQGGTLHDVSTAEIKHTDVQFDELSLNQADFKMKDETFQHTECYCSGCGE